MGPTPCSVRREQGPAAPKAKKSCPIIALAVSLNQAELTKRPSDVVP